MRREKQLGRTGQARLWGIAVVGAVFGALVAYQALNRHRVNANSELIQELRLANLAEESRPAATGDWPQWRGPRRDGLSTETGLLTTWPPGGPKILWKATLGDGFSCPVVVGQRVVTHCQDGNDEAIVCWDFDSGKEQWRFAYPSKYVNGYGSGPRATPTISGDLIYTLSPLGVLHCLKLGNGEKVWRRDLAEEYKAINPHWGISFSPLVEGNRLFLMPGGPDGNSLVALDKNTGQLVWKSGSDAPAYGSPIACTIGGVRQVLFFTAAGLTGAEIDKGEILWHFPWQTNYECNIATPIIRDNYVFISSGYGKGCALLKIEKGGQGKLAVRSVYENNDMCNHFASCVFLDEHLYGFNESILTCMDFRTGAVVWKEKGFKKGSLAIVDGHMIVLSEDGNLVLSEATPKGFKEKAALRIFKDKCWTVPVFVRGKLLVRDEKQMVCLDVGK